MDLLDTPRGRYPGVEGDAEEMGMARRPAVSGRESPLLCVFDNMCYV